MSHRTAHGLLAVLTASASTVIVLASAPPANAGEVSTRSTTLMRLSDPAIVESSGLARSTYARGVLWTHNDKGNDAVVYAVDKQGSTRATVRLSGADNVDWEDIAAGPHHRIWVGDIGDNGLQRAHISVYRFREPRDLVDGSVASTRLDLRYDDGRHNAEGLLVNPQTGRVFVVTKDPDGGGIYRAPRDLSSDEVNTLTRVASAPAKVTAASFYPDGDGFVLCNYTKAWIYRDVRHRESRMDKPPLQQGESITVARDGVGILMGSEGTDSPVYRVVVD
jgi:hypothetical protein